MTPSLTSLSTIPGPDHIGPTAIGSKPTLPWNQGRILVGEKLSDKCCSGFGIFELALTCYQTRNLSVIPSSASMAYPSS
jgi:hypothetical protein